MRRTIVMVCAVVSYESMFFTVLAPLLPHLANRFHLSVAGAGLLNGAYAAGAFAAADSERAAREQDRRQGDHRFPGCCFSPRPASASAIAANVELVFIARLFQGCGCALAWTGGLAWLVAQVPRERRGESIGIALGAALVGALVGPAVGALADLIGTRATVFDVALAVLAGSCSRPGG